MEHLAASSGLQLRQKALEMLDVSQRIRLRISNAFFLVSARNSLAICPITYAKLNKEPKSAQNLGANVRILRVC